MNVQQHIPNGELIFDLFAGGGGASLGLEWGLGRPVDYAVNHSADAVSMHRRNHPKTEHLIHDIWGVDLRAVAGGRPVGLLWASPDCTHFSKAKGGKPRSAEIRSLAWAVAKHLQETRARVFILENVEEFADWGPLLADGRPDPAQKGMTFREWVSHIEALGYRVEWRELRACAYGAPTIRKRLFMVGRRDGQPIVWPEATHGDGRKPFRTAAECIQWHLPCPSIFERKRPLAENTCKRIARGLVRYVIEAQEPFIVTCNHGGDWFRGQGLREPFNTVTGAHDAHGLVVPYVAGVGGRAGQSRERGMHEPIHTITSKADTALIAPTLVQTGYGERTGQAPRAPGLGKPLGTVVGGGQKHALVAAFLAKHYGGVVGHGVERPIGTVTTQDHHSLVASHLVKLRGTCRDGQPMDAPMPTVTAGGLHLAEVRAFLLKYYGTANGQSLREPMHTVTALERFGLVMVEGEPWEIADIGLRMLVPRELFRAQGFPDSYVIHQGHDGRPFSIKTQVKLCGNSVPPYFAAALARANCAELAIGAAEGRVA